MAIDYNGRNIWSGSDGAPVLTYNVDTDRRDIDIADEIPLLQPEATPYLTVLMKARKDPTNSAEFIWYDDDVTDWWTNLSSSYSSVSNHTEDTINVNSGDGEMFRAKDLIKNTETGEIMYIKSITDDALTVERGYGYDADSGWGTEAVDSNGDDDKLMRLGNIMEENSVAPETRATQPSKHFNLVQIFRTPFDASMTNQNEAKRAGKNPRVRLRKKKMIEHRIDIEKQMMFGERYEDISANRRMTGGLLQFIKSKLYDVGSTNSGTLTEAEWGNFCRSAFEYGSDTKLFVTSRRVAQIINQFAAGRIDTTSGDDTYGMQLKQYLSFHGKVILATSKLFENSYSGYGVMIDPDKLAYRPFAGYDSKLRANIENDERLGWKDEYVTCAGLKVELEKSHAILTGVTG